MRNVADGLPRSAVAALGAVLLVTSSDARAHDFRDVWNDGCCEQNVRECNARPGHPDYRCRHGHEADGPLEGAGVLDISCWGAACIGWGGCEPEIETGSVPEVDNDMDDDCDGYVDDEQCDGDDNDGDGAIDEDIGSCMMRLVFVPACYGGTQAELESDVQSRMGFFLSRNSITECADNIHFEVIDKSVMNLDCTGFDSTSACDSGTGTPLARWRAVAAASTAFNLNQFDIMVAVTDQDICGITAGQSNQTDTIWFETEEYIEVLTHEIGHVQGLGDEYCSQAFGSTDARCNRGSPPAPPPPNWLGADLGCDPANSSCCFDTCSGVNVCCDGNRNSLGGSCVMSYAGADDPRHFCSRCASHIFAPPNVRTPTNLTGQVPMDCAFAHLGNTSILSVAYRIDRDGAVDVVSHTAGTGRLGIGGAGSAGNYGIEVRDASDQLLYHSEFDLSFSYHGPAKAGVDYSGISYDALDLAVRAPLPPGATASDRYTMIGIKDGNAVTRTTINGSLPTANAGPELSVECDLPGAGTALLDGTGSSDPDGDTLRYLWSGLSVDNAAIARPTATLPLGSTGVGTLVVFDGTGTSATDTVNLSVYDTTPPAIAAPGPVTLECGASGYVEPGATATDVCDTMLSVSVGGAVVNTAVVGVYTVQYSTTDDSGNAASATRAVTVSDTTAPTITVPGPVTLECGASGYVEPGALASDACDPTLTVTVGGATVNTAVEGVYTVQYSTADDSGNSASATRAVTVTDTTPPTIAAPNVTVERCFPAPAEVLLTVSAADACTVDPALLNLTGQLITVNGHALPAPVAIAGSDPHIVLPVGTSQVRWTATDPHGNAAAPVVQTITVIESDTAAACCAGISTAAVEGNALPNLYILLGNARYCVFGRGGIDTLVAGAQPDLLSGGDALDFITGSNSGDVLLGREGPDSINMNAAGGTVYGGTGNDVIDQAFAGTIYGNAGDDLIEGFTGSHTIYPGPGRDFVDAGPGDDTVVIYNECEVQALEVLDGGFGNDTLITPITIAELDARGVIVTGFNNVVIDASKRHLAECF